MTQAHTLRTIWDHAFPGRIGQLRAAPLHLGAGAEPTLLTASSRDAPIDPSPSMYFHPSDTLRLTAWQAHGRLWEVDLGRGMIPGVWFCPVLPFDLDGDGVDEVWHVDNPRTEHPFDAESYRLVRRDGCTGAITGAWPWPQFERC